MEYKGRTICVSSYERPGEGWVPQAWVFTTLPYGSQGLPREENAIYPTKEKADQAALRIAQAWVDQQADTQA